MTATPSSSRAQLFGVLEVGAKPWDLHRPREPELMSKNMPDEKKEDNFEEQVALARQVYIKSKDLEEHGLTRGCPR